ncbi:hypothetical protein IV203_022625 [Nitzschia inconspicua]|uniref:Uncharacterized protein n=1 Tax=Nitzschia inconspicua TaxID=303405 RepID=A0A9K3KJ64_9STRA|nr:hypothetical protein IV203_022625 [Nitzschia inconspicua]
MKTIPSMLWLSSFLSVIFSGHAFQPSSSFSLSRRQLSFQKDPIRLQLSSSDEKSNNQNSNNQYDQGQVGKGPNWIEKSFPVDTEKKIDVKKVDDYNLGICGKDFQTGSLSKRMYDTIVSRTSLDTGSDDIRQAFTLYAMDFTAKEATRAALNQNGLQLVLQEEEEDQGMWGDVEAVRLYDMETETPLPTLYESLEDALSDWTPGQTFDFVARQVPAKLRELSVEELVQALDPEGTLRQEARELRGSGNEANDDDDLVVDEEALLSIFDDDGITSLAEMANDCVQRTEKAPRGATDETDAFVGLESRGYRVIKRSDLLRDSINDDGTENEKTTMHVMNALVAHGVLLVDLTDGGVTFKDAETMANMWKTTEQFFETVSDPAVAETLPGMTTVSGARSKHAKVGYAEYEGGSMKFLETRRQRNSGDLVPTEAAKLMGHDGVSALQSAFDVVTQVGKDVVRIAVAAGSVEHGAFLDGRIKENERDQKIQASQAATLLSNELVDDGRPLGSDDKEGDVSMSPHRLCMYSGKKDGTDSSHEIFGAHTDSSFVTIVPVASVSGLEVYDEEAEKWYRPELRARKHWEEERRSRGKDPDVFFEELEGGDQIPWHARYVAIMPGEHLQLATRDEVPSAVHRVVVGSKGKPSRLSAPILLRGRPGRIFDTERYLGGTLGNMLLQDADGLSMEDIHDKCQPSSYQ